MWHSLHSIMGRPAKGFMQKQVTRSQESSSGRKGTGERWGPPEPFSPGELYIYQTRWLSVTKPWRHGHSWATAFPTQACRANWPSLSPGANSFMIIHAPVLPHFLFQILSALWATPGACNLCSNHSPESTMMSSSLPVLSSSRNTTCFPWRTIVRFPSVFISVT